MIDTSRKLIQAVADRFKKRPVVCCGNCARRGNGCPIAPRDYAAPIRCVEYRRMQPALRAPKTKQA